MIKKICFTVSIPTNSDMILVTKTFGKQNHIKYHQLTQLNDPFTELKREYLLEY